MRELDKEEGGIDEKCTSMVDIIKTVDHAVNDKLSEEGLFPQFYAMRWIMLLFSQEFDICQSSKLWDSLFPDQTRFKFLSFLCASMALSCRSEVINGDFDRRAT